MTELAKEKFIDPLIDTDFKRGIFNAIVAPRPIGWISTVDKNGKANLAPYSYFNIVSSIPPILAFSCNTPEDRRLKDTLENVKETGEFVYNLASLDLIEQVNMTSTPLPRGEDEFVFAGLEKAPSNKVAPPRVREAPVSLECKVLDIVSFGHGIGETPTHVTFGQVVGLHIKERFLDDGGNFLTELAQPVARLGGAKYATLAEPFELEKQFRPANAKLY